MLEDGEGTGECGNGEGCSLWLLQEGQFGWKAGVRSSATKVKEERAWNVGAVQTLTGMLTQPLIGYVVLGKLSDISKFQLPLSHL